MEEIQEIDGLALFQTGQLGQLKRAQLQKLCKSHGLSAGGKNAEMIDRLCEYFTEDILEDKENVQPPLPLEQPKALTDGAAAKLGAAAEERCDFEDGGNNSATEQQSEQNESMDSAKATQQPSVDATDKDAERLLAEVRSPGRARSKSVADQLKEELESRVKQETKAKLQTTAGFGSGLQRSKSVYFHAGHTDQMEERCQHRKKWDLIHKQQFNKMVSIASHYSTKRNQPPVVKTTDQLLKRKLQSSKIALPARKVEQKQRNPAADENQPSTFNCLSAVKEPGTPRRDKKDTLLQRIVAQLSGSKKKNTQPVKLEGNDKAVNSSSSKFLSKLQSAMRPATQTVVVPAVSTANAEAVKPSAKKPFDLKASLARPLNYKPYTGKLKPLEHTKN